MMPAFRLRLFPCHVRFDQVAAALLRDGDVGTRAQTSKALSVLIESLAPGPLALSPVALSRNLLYCILDGPMVDDYRSFRLMKSDE